MGGGMSGIKSGAISTNAKEVPRELPDGLTFYADFEKGNSSDTNAVFPVYSMGAPTSLFTTTRSATNSATYIDSNGAIRQVTSSDTPRINSCLYDSTGLLTNKRGLIVESSGTNLLTYSDALDTNWGKTTVTVATNTTDVTDLYGTNKSTKLTATGADSSLAQDYNSASTSTTYTFSCYIRCNTGTNSVKLYLYDDDSQLASTDMALTTSWKRYSVTLTTGGSATKVTAQIGGSNTFSTGEIIYAMGCQLETGSYATSLIPTTSSSATRGTTAEVLKYLNSGNRTASEETQFIKIIPFWNKDTIGASSRVFLETDTKTRHFAAGWYGRITSYPNSSDSVQSEANIPPATANTQNHTSYVIAAIAKHTGTYAQTYINGSLLSDGVREDLGNATDFTNPAWGIGFYVGSSNGNDCFSGIIQKVLIFNRALSASEVATVSQWLGAN